jgi:hypothetical protein
VVALEWCSDGATPFALRASTGVVLRGAACSAAASTNRSLGSGKLTSSPQGIHGEELWRRKTTTRFGVSEKAEREGHTAQRHLIRWP